MEKMTVRPWYFISVATCVSCEKPTFNTRAQMAIGCRGKWPQQSTHCWNKGQGIKWNIRPKEMEKRIQVEECHYWTSRDSCAVCRESDVILDLDLKPMGKPRRNEKWKTLAQAWRRCWWFFLFISTVIDHRQPLAHTKRRKVDATKRWSQV